MRCEISMLNGFSVITPTIRRECIERVINNYVNQNFEIKELIIIINNDDIDINEYEKYTNKYSDIKVFKLPQNMNLGECLNFGVYKAKYDIIAKFDDDDYYGDEYLSEMYNAFQNKCDVVGKAKIYYYFEELKELRLYLWREENSYANWIAGPTICFKKEVFSKVKFRNIPSAVDTYFLNDCVKNRLRIYSTSSNNFIIYRGIDPQKHTWKVSLNDLLRVTKTVKSNITYTEAYKLVEK